MFFEEWYDPLISGIRWTEELVEIAGGDPIFPELADAGLAKDRIVTGEQVIARAPDVIIGSWCGKPVRKERIAARPGWQDVPAVRNGQIYEVKSTYILQPGPAALTEGVTRLHDVIRRRRGYNVEMTRIAFVLALAVLAAACRNLAGRRHRVVANPRPPTPGPSSTATRSRATTSKRRIAARRPRASSRRTKKP